MQYAYKNKACVDNQLLEGKEERESPDCLVRHGFNSIIQKCWNPNRRDGESISFYIPDERREPQLCSS